jgi:hypothetical protein
VVKQHVRRARRSHAEERPMMPLADIVAFSTSVSNHWSRKSTALIVMSWTWL